MTAAAHRPEHPDLADPADVADTTDAVLLARARTGDPDAVAVLFERYHPVALAIATRQGGPDVAPDLAATAFERILRLLRQGKGPTTAFRPYLAATVNSAWVDHVRRDSRLVLVEDDDELEPLVAAPSDGADDRFDRATVAAAFADLPSRWQHVLWHTAVEGMAHEEIGEALGLSGNAVAALAHRAREGLRTAYLDAHLAAAVDEGCRRTAPLLGAYVRGAMSLGKRQGVTDHLADCDRCRHAVAELGQVSANLGAVLLPLLGLLAAEGLPGAAGGTAAGTTSEASPRSRWRRTPRRTTQVVVAAAVLVAVVLVAAAAVVRPWAEEGPAVATTPSRATDPAAPAAPEVPAPPASVTSEPSEPSEGVEVTGPQPPAAPAAAEPGAAAPGPAPAPAEPTAPGGPDPSPPPPAVDPADNPRFERSRLVVAPAAQPGWTRVTLPVVAASPGTVVTMTVRGAREVCVLGAGGPRCTAGSVTGWTVPALPAAEPLVVEVRHDALTWIGFALEALDRPDDVPADNHADAILRADG